MRVIVVLLLYAVLAGCQKDEKRNAMLTEPEIESYIQRSDIGLFSPEVLAKIEKREYSFPSKFIASSKLDTRQMLLSFLKEMNQPWCCPYFKKALLDNAREVRVAAAEGILALSTAANPGDLYGCIESMKKHNNESDAYVEAMLILSIGNWSENKDIGELRRRFSKDTRIEIQSAYEKVMVKLREPEFEKAVREQMSSVDRNAKQRAMEAIAYSRNKAWIPTVSPLLLDENEVYSFAMGRSKTQIIRVCDMAINTLMSIDPTLKVPFPRSDALPYPMNQIEAVREIYGIRKKGGN